MNFTVLTATVQPNLDVNYIGMDVHSDNVVVCVRRNTGICQDTSKKFVRRLPAPG